MQQTFDFMRCCLLSSHMIHLTITPYYQEFFGHAQKRTIFKAKSIKKQIRNLWREIGLQQKTFSRRYYVKMSEFSLPLVSKVFL